MTKAVFYKQNGSFRGVSVKGHSGYGEAGSDIVCAAVSSMMNLTIAFLENSGADYSSKADAQNAGLELYIAEDESCDNLFNSLYDCMQSVADEYRKFLSVKIFDKE